jgi:hypothetical protein
MNELYNLEQAALESYTNYNFQKGLVSCDLMNEPHEPIRCSNQQSQQFCSCHNLFVIFRHHKRLSLR